jgi:hypothetical protein
MQHVPTKITLSAVRNLATILLCGTTGMVFSCRDAETDGSAKSELRVSKAEFQTLRWLEGNRRGLGGKYPFIPVKDANTTFSWEYQSSAAWIARLHWTNAQGQSIEKEYRMERLPGESP